VKFPADAHRVGLVVGAVALAALPACSTTWGAPEARSEQGREILGLWRLFMPVAIVIGLLVWGLITWCIVRYRRREDGLPPQTRENLRIEIVYTAVPLVVVVVLFTASVVVQRRVDRVASRPDLTVEVEGFQWQWRFRYVDQGVTVTGVPEQPPELVLPVGKRAHFVLTARDVIHSFYVPGFLFKRDAIPGIVNRFDITPRQPGRYAAACAEFCGLRHDAMRFAVSVVAPSEFEDWVTDRRHEPAP
jgi:cytochrome c oxidase subunit 2